MTTPIADTPRAQTTIIVPNSQPMVSLLGTRDEFLRLARSYKAEHDANVERIAGTGDTGGMHTENIWYGGMTHAMDMMGLALGGSLYQEGFAIMRPDEWAEVCRRVEAGKAGV